MLTAIVGTIIVLLAFAVVVAVAKDNGPGPDDVAVSYEHAWDRLDFDAIWTLSAKELRDGLDRKQFIEAKRAAYAERGELRRIMGSVTVDDMATRRDNAIVHTRVELRDGAVVHNTLQLVRRSFKWQVVAYALTTSGESINRDPG